MSYAGAAASAGGSGGGGAKPAPSGPSSALGSQSGKPAAPSNGPAAGGQGKGKSRNIDPKNLAAEKTWDEKKFEGKSDVDIEEITGDLFSCDDTFSLVR